MGKHLLGREETPPASTATPSASTATPSASTITPSVSTTTPDGSTITPAPISTSSPTQTSPSSSESLTTSSKATHAAKASPNVITPGEAAGIGIGSAVAGAILTFLLFYIFMKRSNHSKHGKHRRSRETESEKPLPRSDIVLDENLLEKADDSQIRKGMVELNELIDQHVENYYDLRSFDGSQENLELELVECGFGTGLSSTLKNPKTRFAGIRHVIATVITKNISSKAAVEFSLLSPKIAAFCQSMPPVEHQPGSEEVFDKAFTKWRQMSAFLLSPTRSTRDLPQANEQELRNAINQNVTLINGVLQPFIKTGEMQRYQEDNMKAIIFHGAQLGLLLFCQPSVWVFSWRASSREERNRREKDGTQVATTDMSRARMWVVFPGISERAEKHGRQMIREVVAPVAVDL